MTRAKAGIDQPAPDCERTMKEEFRHNLLALAVVLTASAASSFARAEAPWQWRHHRLPRVLAAQGLWNDQYRLPEALSAAGGANLQEALHYHGARSSGLHYLRGEGLHGFPKQADDLLDHDLLVLTNVAARAFSDEQKEMIKAFVSNGGGLLLLGGYWTLDKGGMSGTVFEELLPVKISNRGGRLPHERDGLSLVPKGDHPLTALPDWAASPRLFYHNRIMPKADAVVVVTAGEQPILALGKHGQGRTAVFAGTVCGVVPEGVTAFWDWDDWPVFLAGVIEWLWSPRRQLSAKIEPRPEPESQGLTEEEREDLAFAEGEEKLALIKKGLKSCDLETAQLLFEELTDNADMEADLQVSVMQAIRPYASPDWAEPLLTMDERLDPGSRREWLPLLGAAGSPGVLTVLLKSAEAADVDVRRAALEGLARLGSPKAIPVLKRLRTGMGELGIEKALDQYEFRDLLPGPEDLRVDVLVALYRSGAPDTPGQLLNAFDRYLFYAEYTAAFLRSKGPAASDIQGKLLRKDILYRHRSLRAKGRRIEQSFLTIPPGLESDFVRAANTETRPHCLRLVYRAIEYSLSEENAEQFTGLCRARDPGVARLATTTVLGLTAMRAADNLLAAIRDEWKQADSPRRRRLLMLARALPPKEGKEVFTLGLGDADPAVKRQADALTRR